MLTFANPYTPATPIGAGLQNIAMALFAGRNAKNDALDASRVAQAENYGAHSDLYREQTKKTAAERAIAESLLGARSPDSQDFLRSSEAGMPIHTLRGIDAALKGQAPLDQYSQDEIARHRRATVAIQPAYADKTTSPVDIARALDSLRSVDDRNAVIGGKQDPTRTAQGYFATSGKAPYDNMGGTGSFNQLTGVQSLNEYGTAKALAERALGRDRNAQAGQRELETRTGIKIGAPVMVNDPEVGPMFTSPSAAVGRPPAAKPGGPTRLKPVVDENGDTIYVPDSEAAYALVGRPGGNTARAPRKISGTDRALFDNSLNSLLAETNVKALDDQTRNAVLLQAEKEWQDGAEGHGNAVKNALDKIAPGGLETPWQWRSFTPFDSKAQAKGGAQTPAPAAQARQGSPATDPRSNLPPAAKAKLRDGVNTTFKNGQVWTLMDGVAARVR